MTEGLAIDKEFHITRMQGIEKIKYFLDRAEKETNKFNVESDFYAIQSLAQQIYVTLRSLNND